MSGNTYFADGQWNAACFRCGFKFKSSELRKTWQGFWCCDKCWEPRHPQDFVRGVPDDPGVPWCQDDSWVFVGPNILLCTIPSKSAIPGYAGPGCSTPGVTYTGLN